MFSASTWGSSIQLMLHVLFTFPAVHGKTACLLPVSTLFKLKLTSLLKKKKNLIDHGLCPLGERS